MPTEDEFIQNIAANPDDDTPRLVFSDWLDEQGDTARAEFIRVQCELARVDERSPRYLELRDRELGLKRKHGWRWWRDAFDPNIYAAKFWRGVLEEFSVPLNWAIQRAPELFQCYPLLRHLKLRDVEDDGLVEFMRLLGTAQLVTLSLSRTTQVWNDRYRRHYRHTHLDEGVLAVARSPFLSNLESLDVSTLLMTDRAVDALRTRFGRQCIGLG